MRRKIALRLHFFYSSILLLIVLSLTNCDSTVTPDSAVIDLPIIESITSDPAVVQFTLENDGYKDTTVTINLSATIDLNGSSENPTYVVSLPSTREIITSGNLNSSGGTLFQTNIDFETSTTQFSNYLVQVFAFADNGNSTYAEKNIELIGFSNSRPHIIEVNNPAEVNRPSDGEIFTQFTAKVTDLDGQTTIDRVLVRILDILGADVPDSPFEMFDDGTTYSDVAASDSVYSITFPIAAIPGRETQSFFIEYFAIDQGGIYSDTTRTTFKITNNQ